MIPETKFCPKCQTTKGSDEFYKNRAREDGLYATCKSCTKAYQKHWHQRNPDKHAEYFRKWLDRNKETLIF